MKKNNQYVATVAAFCTVLSYTFGLYIAGKLLNAHFIELSAIAVILFCILIPTSIVAIVSDMEQ